MALPVRDDRGLEVDVRRRALVVQALGELERALDVLARGLQIAAPAVAARAPGEHVRAQMVRRDLGALGQCQRLVEEAERRLDAVQLVAGDAEAEEDVGALDVGEGLAFAERARSFEERDRLAYLAAPHSHRRLARERP